MKVIKKLVLFLNGMAALILIVAGISIYVDPSRVWVLPFFGLIFFWLVTINLFFFFFWIVTRWKYTLISVAAFIVSFPVTKHFIAFHFFSSKSPDKNIRVMSYNVRNFDLYNWTDQENILKDIMQLLDEANPDIICFQEFYNAPSGDFQTIKQLKKMGYPYYYFEKSFTRETEKDSWGIAVFSQYPIVHRESILFDNPTFNRCQFTDIKVDSAVFRVVNVHLQSIYLSEENYHYIGDVSEYKDVKLEPSKEIIRKFKRAFIYRAQQAQKIRESLKESPYPIILCGDFNDSPASYSYQVLSENFQDAFLKAGWGIGPTYAGLFKTYRIDYILAGEQFEVSDYKTICKKFSDHYPVIATLSLVP